MSVETAATDGVEATDLSGTGFSEDSNVTVVTQTTVDPNADLLEGDSVTEGEGDTSQESDAGAKEDGASEESQQNTEDSNADDNVIEFGGGRVDLNNLEVPEEFQGGLEKQGLDPVAVAKEMYSEDGLTDATKLKLYEEFGKSTVDLYVKSQRALAEQQIKELNEKQTDSDKFYEDVNTSVDELLGDGLQFDTLAAWVAKNVSPEERAELNEDLRSGRKSTILRTVRDLKARYVEANGEQGVTLEQGSGAQTTSQDNAPLTAAEYRALFVSGEYYKNPQGYDARRVAGQQAGI